MATLIQENTFKAGWTFTVFPLFGLTAVALFIFALANDWHRWEPENQQLIATISCSLAVPCFLWVFFLPSTIAFKRKHLWRWWFPSLSMMVGTTVLGWFFLLFWAAEGEQDIAALIRAEENRRARDAIKAHQRGEGMGHVYFPNGAM